MWAGVDVAKRHLDVACDGSDEVRRFANDQAGIARLLRWLGSQAVTAFVVEATGGYERALLEAAARADLPATRVNPRQVRDFARHGPAREDRRDRCPRARRLRGTPDARSDPAHR